MSWRWTCTVCPETGSADTIEDTDRGYRHAATHASGPYDVVPTIYVESITDQEPVVLVPAEITSGEELEAERRERRRQESGDPVLCSRCCRRAATGRTASGSSVCDLCGSTEQ